MALRVLRSMATAIPWAVATQARETSSKKRCTKCCVLRPAAAIPDWMLNVLPARSCAWKAMRSSTSAPPSIPVDRRDSSSSVWKWASRLTTLSEMRPTYWNSSMSPLGSHSPAATAPLPISTKPISAIASRAGRSASRAAAMPRGAPCSGTLQLGEQRGQHLPVQAVADLRVDSEPMALFRREPGFHGQRRRRTRLLEKARVLGPDSRTRAGPFQGRRPEPDRFQHEGQALIRLRQVETDVEMVVLVALPGVDAAAITGNQRHRAAPYTTTSMRWGPCSESATDSARRRESTESAREAGTPIPRARCTQSS